LHFEYHNPKGETVNPYQYLRAVQGFDPSGALETLPFTGLQAAQMGLNGAFLAIAGGVLVLSVRRGPGFDGVSQARQSL
jgi:hypothetical protein